MKTTLKKSWLFIVALSLCFALYSCDTIQSTETEKVKKHTDNIIYGNEYTEKPFIVHKRSLKFHYSDCYYANIMNEENKIYFYGSFEEAEERGYSHCYYCGE